MEAIGANLQTYGERFSCHSFHTPSFSVSLSLTPFFFSFRLRHSNSILRD
jgi:hypothetical protein